MPAWSARTHVVLGHRFDTSTNTDVNLAHGDLVGYLIDRGKTGGALAVQGIDGRRRREAGPESGHAGNGGSTAGREDVSDGNVLDELGVDLGLGNDALRTARRGERRDASQ